MKPIVIAIAYIKMLWAGLRYPERYLVDNDVERIGGTICEFTVTDMRTGKVVGYWQFGAYDPAYPYRGRMLDEYLPIAYRFPKLLSDITE